MLEDQTYDEIPVFRPPEMNISESRRKQLIADVTEFAEAAVLI